MPETVMREALRSGRIYRLHLTQGQDKFICEYNYEHSYKYDLRNTWLAMNEMERREIARYLHKDYLEFDRTIKYTSIYCGYKYDPREGF